MKLHKVVLGAAAAFASVALAVPAIAGGSIKDAPARVPGIYVEFGAGVGWYDDTTWTSIIQPHKNEFDNGEVFRLAVGTRLPYGLRGEIEGSFRSNHIEKDTASGTVYVMNGGVRTYALMGNVFYDFKMAGITPFVGAGAGWAHLDVDTNFTTGGPFVQTRGTDNRFAYQLMAGVAVPLGNSISLTARYTFFDTVGDKMSAFNTGIGTTTWDVPYSNHSATVGIRFGF